MATDAKTTRKPWRAPEDVCALTPATPSASEAKILAALDDARAALATMQAGRDALARRLAAAEAEAADLRGLAGIGQATDAEAVAAEANAEARRVAVADAAEGLAAAAARVAELEDAAARARSDSHGAFADAMKAADRNARQDLVAALAEASRCVSVLHDVNAHAALYGVRLPPVYLPEEIRADTFTFRDWMRGAERDGFDVPELPPSEPSGTGAGSRFRMTDPHA